MRRGSKVPEGARVSLGTGETLGHLEMKAYVDLLDLPDPRDPEYVMLGIGMELGMGTG